MNPFNALCRLGRRLFRSPISESEPKLEARKETKTSKFSIPEVSPTQPLIKPIPEGRNPYFAQIGLDFGTAYSKCICRDIITDKAWVFRPKKFRNNELPFLIPCILTFRNGYLSVPHQSNEGYLTGGLPHLKMALQNIAIKKWTDPVLQPYQEEFGKTDVFEFVRACAVYLISGILGSVRSEIETRFPGHHSDDYIAINMALPVANTEDPEVKSLFQEVLQLAWALADQLNDHPEIKVADLISLINEFKSEADQEKVREACFLYPEVGANVQGFIRSRASSPGIYLFSDTGAGTVDQSLFIFSRRGGIERLTFLHAAVFPLGSSHIERLALKQAGEVIRPKNLDKWRIRKEAGEQTGPLFYARQKIGDKLGRKTMQTIACAKLKLRSKGQMNELKVIFGGGGQCRNPYKNAVREQFNSIIFSNEKINNRKHRGDSLSIGMPIPTDFNDEGINQNWINRLTVAYGLAFAKDDLARFKLPSEVEIPKPEEIFRRKMQEWTAPSKDDC